MKRRGRESPRQIMDIGSLSDLGELGLAPDLC